MDSLASVYGKVFIPMGFAGVGCPKGCRGWPLESAGSGDTGSCLVSRAAWPNHVGQAAGAAAAREKKTLTGSGRPGGLAVEADS